MVRLRKAHEWSDQVPGERGANFSLQLKFDLLELKGAYMPANTLSYQLRGVLLSSGQYVGLQDFSLMVSLKWGITTTGDAQLTYFLYNQLLGLEYQPLRGHSHLKPYDRIMGFQLISTLIPITMVLMFGVPFTWEYSLSPMGLSSGGTVSWICLHSPLNRQKHSKWLVFVIPVNRRVNGNRLWVIQADRLISTEMLHTSSTGPCYRLQICGTKKRRIWVMQMTANGAAIHVRLISKWKTLCAQQLIALFMRFFGDVAVHKYNDGSKRDIKLQLRAPYMGDDITRLQLNDWFTKDKGVFLVRSLQVKEKRHTNYTMMNHTLDYVCRYLPCFNQWLGFLIRHKWSSKEVLFLERKAETTTTSTRDVGVVLEDYFELQQYTQVHSSLKHTCTTKSTTNYRDGKAKVGEKTCLRLQLYMQIPLEPKQSYQLALMRIIFAALDQLLRQPATRRNIYCISRCNLSNRLVCFTSFILEDKNVLKVMVLSCPKPGGGCPYHLDVSIQHNIVGSL